MEVKERNGASHGARYEAVTAAKRSKMVAAARFYAMGHGLEAQAIHFDVVSVDWVGTTPAIRHDQGAFDGDGR